MKKKLVAFLFGAAIIFGTLLYVTQTHATVRIADDRGGRIGTYVDKYQELSLSGQNVIIDGLCASACTIVLGAIAHDKICVTSHASLGFHAAWDPSLNELHNKIVAVTNQNATRAMYNMYPSVIKHWITAHGGLTTPQKMIWLKGKELSAMYRPCRPQLDTNFAHSLY